MTLRRADGIAYGELCKEEDDEEREETVGGGLGDSGGLNRSAGKGRSGEHDDDDGPNDQMFSTPHPPDSFSRRARPARSTLPPLAPIHVSLTTYDTAVGACSATWQVVARPTRPPPATFFHVLDPPGPPSHSLQHGQINYGRSGVGRPSSGGERRRRTGRIPPYARHRSC